MTEQLPKIDVFGHEKWYQAKKEMLAKEDPESVAYMESWAVLMQQKMADNNGVLTQKIVNETQNKASLEGFDPWTSLGADAFYTLVIAWNRGADLAQFSMYNAINPDECAVIRALAKDHAYDFIKKYPDADQLGTSTRQGQRAENIRILSTIFPSVDLVDKFETMVSTSRWDCNALLKDWLPMLNLDNRNNMWRSDLQEVCKGARQRLTELSKKTLDCSSEK